MCEGFIRAVLFDACVCGDVSLARDHEAGAPFCGGYRSVWACGVFLRLTL